MSWRKLPRSARLFIVIFLYAAVLAGHVFAVNFYVTRFSDKVDSKEIAVAVKDIPLHTVIRQEDLALKRVRLADVVDGAFTSTNVAVGKESTAPMSRNEQLTVQKINEVVKREGQMIIEIPGEWLLSFPKSLRRLDKIRLLPVYQITARERDGILLPGEAAASSAGVVSSGTNGPAKANGGTNGSAAASGGADGSAAASGGVGIQALAIGAQNGSAATNGATFSQAAGNVDRSIAVSPLAERIRQNEKLTGDITVAYFKDTSANEVADQAGEGSVEDTPRLHATNVGARLEVALTPEQFAFLQDLALNRYKFVVSYN
jgi:hypothetical protein